MGGRLVEQIEIVLFCRNEEEINDQAWVSIGIRFSWDEELNQPQWRKRGSEKRDQSFPLDTRRSIIIGPLHSARLCSFTSIIWGKQICFAFSFSSDVDHIRFFIGYVFVRALSFFFFFEFVREYISRVEILLNFNHRLLFSIFNVEIEIIENRVKRNFIFDLLKSRIQIDVEIFFGCWQKRRQR